MSKTKKLTINDIAKMAGVAKSTVSRFLNGGSVGSATGAKIKKIIDAHGYEPNFFARLNAKNSQVVGIVVPSFNAVTTPRLVEVIVAYLKRHEYTPLIMHTGNSKQEELRSIIRLNKINADGIMVLSTGITEAHHKLVHSLDIPVLFLGQKYLGLNSIIYDDYNAGLELGKYLAQQQFTRIYGIWVNASDPAVGIYRRSGIEDGLAMGRAPEAQFFETSFIYQEAADAIRAIFANNPIPDALICATDRIAEAAYKVCKEHGLVVGRDISVTGFGDYSTSELLTPPLTTVRFDWQKWGEVSAETMLQMMQQRPVSELQVVPYQLVYRNSVAELQASGLRSSIHSETPLVRSYTTHNPEQPLPSNISENSVPSSDFTGTHLETSSLMPSSNDSGVTTINANSSPTTHGVYHQPQKVGSTAYHGASDSAAETDLINATPVATSEDVLACNRNYLDAQARAQANVRTCSRISHFHTRETNLESEAVEDASSTSQAKETRKKS